MESKYNKGLEWFLAARKRRSVQHGVRGQSTMNGSLEPIPKVSHLSTQSYARWGALPGHCGKKHSAWGYRLVIDVQVRAKTRVDSRLSRDIRSAGRKHGKGSETQIEEVIERLRSQDN
jgi:hypothetical protein